MGEGSFTRWPCSSGLHAAKTTPQRQEACNWCMRAFARGYCTTAKREESTSMSLPSKSLYAWWSVRSTEHSAVSTVVADTLAIHS